ncbi:arsenate reductase/protein-tyrosine-phosphatase family protein [Rhodococcus sp. NPDC003382]
MASARRSVPSFVQLAAHPVRWQLLTTLSGSDHRVREMVSLIGEPQNLISYHLRLLRDGGLVRATRSSFDGRDSYYHLDLDRCTEMLAGAGAALHPALGRTLAPPAPGPAPAPVLFVCTGNSARSAIAEALLRWRTDGVVEAISAGTRPKPDMHPDTVRVLREEFGIDLGDRRPRHLDTLAGRRFGTVVTLCDKAREVCPEFGDDDTRRIHWSIPDPAAAGGADEDTYPAFRATATEIDTRIGYLIATLTTPP